MNHLVILAPNWLGDAVMALPAIADVRRAAPGAAITVAARSAIAPLFQLVPQVNDTIVLPRPPAMRDLAGWRSLGTKLSGRQFDAALLFPNSLHSALLVSRAGIPERWGYRAGWRRGLLTRAIERTAGLHQIDSYQQLVHALGFPNGPLEPRAVVPQSARDAAHRLLVESGWNGLTPLVALAPGAAYGGAKRWPPEYFAELAGALAIDGVATVIVGSAADAATADEVVRGRHENGDAARQSNRNAARADGNPKRIALYNVAGRTDLATLAGVLSLCRGLVTNDSGAMHLAAAVGTSVTAVFGPTDDTATRPIGDAHAVLTHPVWCRPCMLRECPIDHRCMRGVTVSAVLDSARRIL